MGHFFSLAIVLFGILGWVLNIITLSQADHFTGMVVVRALGVLVAPLGAVIGYF